MADILINPVTRINGNAGARIVLDENGDPQEACFEAFGYRGFEQMVKGAHVENILPIVSRICGSDSVFHQIAAAMAVENALGVEPPEQAVRLRELAMWGQLFERHAVSLTVHSLPDLLFPSSDPGLRNIISINRVDEEVIRRVMALKSLGTYIFQKAGGRMVHAVNFVPGGVVFEIPEDARREILERMNEARPLLIETAHLVKLLLRRNEEAVNTLGTAPTSCLSIKGEEGVELRGSVLEVVNAEGQKQSSIASVEIHGKLEDSNSPRSHIRNSGLSGIGEVRVGPLARLNVNGSYGSPLADEELEEIKSQWGFPLHRNMVSHAARILEMIHAWERMADILGSPPGEALRNEVAPGAGKGTGTLEAPEGTLVYNLVLDEGGAVNKLSITAPLQFNLKALENNLQESARAVLGGAEADQRAVIMMETAIRAHAPCVPCAVH